MPAKEIITLGGFREPAVKITFTVGAGGDNGPADVMLIQTLFHYISNINGMPMKNIGFPLTEIPEITGRCDAKTKKAILSFQRKNAGKLLNIDGLIHPAAYQGRNIRAGEPRVMTMTLLHYYATDMAVHRSESNYIDGLIKMVPQLRPWLS